MIHHLPAHGQQYVLDSVGHRKTGAVQQGDIFVSKLACLWLLAQQRYRMVPQNQRATMTISEFPNDKVLKYHRQMRRHLGLDGASIPALDY
jgi:hypothetical protein